nr:hypothetical protein [Piscirickettsia salmonis]
MNMNSLLSVALQMTEGVLKPSLLTTEQSLPVMRPFQRSLKQTFTLLDLIVLVIEV